MSCKVFEQLGVSSPDNGKRDVLKNAEQGKVMGLAKDYDVTLEVGSKSVTCMWPLFRTLLMGLDFMLQNDVTIQKGCNVYIDGEPLPSYLAGRDVKAYAVSRVLVIEPSILPPQSECDIWGTVENPQPGHTAVLEPTGLADGVSSGSVLVEMNQRVPIRVCNLSFSSTKLLQGTCLGILETEPLPMEPPLSQSPHLPENCSGRK